MSPRLPPLELGERFERLSVVGPPQMRTTKSGRRQTVYPLECDCGARTWLPANRLRSGNTRSCGCLAQDPSSRGRLRHGMSGTRLYRIWSAMKQRCTNPKSDSWSRYGGRGISVCADWAKDYVNFHTWAMASGYEDGLELDRIDPNGDYGPSNCRWLTRLGQLENRLVYLDPELELWLRTYSLEAQRTPYTVIKLALDRHLSQLGH